MVSQIDLKMLMSKVRQPQALALIPISYTDGIETIWLQQQRSKITKEEYDYIEHLIAKTTMSHEIAIRFSREEKITWLKAHTSPLEFEFVTNYFNTWMTLEHCEWKERARKNSQKNFKIFRYTAMLLTTTGLVYELYLLYLAASLILYL